MGSADKDDYFRLFHAVEITATKHARILRARFTTEDPRFPPVAVVKVFHSFDPDQLREVSILIDLEGTHPNVVTMYHHILAKDRTYLFMELCKGGALSGMIEKRKKEKRPWTNSELLGYFGQLADGMKFLHQKKIIHRDIKPDNILLTENNVPKIADFGESKQVHQTAAEQLQTLRGTRAYMSPQLTGVYSGVECWPTNESGYADDVWAMGRTFYEMAMLETKPWMNTLHEHGEGKLEEYVRTSLRRKNIAPLIAAVIEDMLRVNAASRPDFTSITQSLHSIPRQPCDICSDLVDPSIPHLPCGHSFCHVCYRSFLYFLETSVKQASDIICPKSDCGKVVSMGDLRGFPLTKNARERLKIVNFLELTIECKVCGGKHNRMKEVKSGADSIVSPYIIECGGQFVCSYCGRVGGHFFLGIKRRCPEFNL